MSAGRLALESPPGVMTSAHLSTVVLKTVAYWAMLRSSFPVNKMRKSITVILEPSEYARFEAYCRLKGFKKSTLIARLLREHLEAERFVTQTELFPNHAANHA